MRPKGDEHLAQRPRRLHAPEQREVEDGAERGDGERRHGERDPVGAGERDRLEAGVGADHVERAVRQVDEVHQPEHHRQADREHEQEAGELEAVQRLDGEEGGVEERHRGRPRATALAEDAAVRRVLHRRQSVDGQELDAAGRGAGLEDVDVLDDVVGRRVDPERPARPVEGGAPHGGDERRLVAGLTAGRRERLGDQVRGVVALDRILGGDAAVAGAVGGLEGAVGVVVDPRQVV